MIGQTIEKPGKFSFGAVCYLLLALLALVAAVGEKNIHWAIFAVLPFMLAIGLWYAARGRLLATIDEQQLQFYWPNYTIPYSGLQSVYFDASANPKRPVLHLDTDQGLISLPSRLNISLDDLHDFLAPRVLPAEAAQPHPDMAEYVHAQQETFGADRVFVFRTRNRKRLTIFRLPNWWATFWLSICLTGVLWIILSLVITNKDRFGWTGSGAMLTIFGFLFWLLTQQRIRGAAISKANADACLVISPLGIAMIQGDVRGKLEWDEIRKVVGAGKAKGFQVQALKGLQIHVAGSMIQVLDIYDVPLGQIEALIRQNM